MNENLVKVQRDSVCMGDDVNAPHEYIFKMDQNLTLSFLFEHLKNKNYLASVSGKNHSWEAVINNQVVALFSGNNKTPESSETLEKKISKFSINNEVNINFKYNSTIT